MLTKVKNTIDKHSMLTEGQTVLVGFSGGADSCALLYSLYKLGYNVIAIHVEHGIRGKEALDDANFAKDLCSALNIQCFIEHVNIPKLAKELNISTETAARRERYRIFNEYSKQFSAPIAVAHNKNDQAETVLMHLLRGSSLNGLCGMKYISGNIIRPLMCISREEIEDFNKANNIDYRTDSTNLLTEYTRNKVRLQIMPLLEETFSGSLNSIVSCAESLSQYNTYIQEQVEQYAKDYISKIDEGIVLRIGNVTRVIYFELIKKSLHLLNGHLTDIEGSHLEDIFQLCQKNSGKEIHLPYNTTAKRVYDEILFFNNAESIEYCYDLSLGSTYDFGNFNVRTELTNSAEKQNDCELLDFDKLPKDLTVRTRQSGDYIYPLGSPGKCTLKKYFINKKIPSTERADIPLLAQGSEVFAILGYTVSEKAKLTEKTKNILKFFKEK